MTDLPALWQRTPTDTLQSLLAGARVWCPGDPDQFEAGLTAELNTRTAPDPC